MIVQQAKQGGNISGHLVTWYNRIIYNYVFIYFIYLYIHMIYIYIWTQKCTLSLANQLREVADAFRPLRTHQHYWTIDWWTSQKSSPSNR